MSRAILSSHVAVCSSFVWIVIALLVLTIAPIATTQVQAFSSTSTCISIAVAPFSKPRPPKNLKSRLYMAQVSEGEAKKGIDTVVAALRRDKEAVQDLGKLVKVNNILGFGSPRDGILAVRFNASFQKGGKGLSSVPLPFGLGQSNVSEGRGSMVGQVKASIDSKSGKVLECSVFRDLGYGRAFNLKVKK